LFGFDSIVFKKFSDTPLRAELLIIRILDLKPGYTDIENPDIIRVLKRIIRVLEPKPG
jgi:hypothetical protein